MNYRTTVILIAVLGAVTLAIVLAIAIPQDLPGLGQHQSSNQNLTDLRCVTIVGISEQHLIDCKKDSYAYLSSIYRTAATSKLVFDKGPYGIALRAKLPHNKDPDSYTEDTILYLDDYLHLDTGSTDSFMYSETPINPSRSTEYFSYTGLAKNHAIEEKQLTELGFSVDNVNYIDISEASLHSVNSEFKGLIGLDFLIAAKSICLDFEHAILKPNCFQPPDEVGRILVPNSALLYIPITYDHKEMFALIDTGIGRTKYVSNSCQKKETFQSMDEHD